MNESETNARLEKAEKLIGALATLIIAGPPHVAEPEPGVNLDAFDDNLDATINGRNGEPGLYAMYSDPSPWTSRGLTLEQALGGNLGDFHRWHAALEAGIVENTPAGLKLLTVMLGHGEERAVSVAGEQGRAAWAWFQIWNAAQRSPR